MKKLVLVLSTLITSTLFAANLDLNSGDIVTIMANHQTTVSCNGGNVSQEITNVRFYKSRYCGDTDFLTEIKFTSDIDTNSKRCESRAEGITKTIWSIMVNGVCEETPMNSRFIEVCKRFL